MQQQTESKPRTPETLVRSSKANIRVNCSGSVIFYDPFPPQTQNEHTIEGTLAHEWAAKALLKGTKVLKKCEDAEMREHVENYAKFVKRLERKCGGFDEKWVEQGVVHLPGIHQGTSDCAALYKNRKRLIVVDFKYGKGVPVVAENNQQCLSYLFCIMEHHNIKKLDQATMFIFQPRARDGFGAVRFWTLNWEEICAERERFYEGVRKCIEVHEGRAEPEFNFGDHCRWCNGKVKCETYRASINKEVGSYLGERNQNILPNIYQLPPKKLSRLLKVEESVKALFSEAREYIQRELEKGSEDFPDWKLVESRSNRVWKKGISEKRIEQDLKALGVKDPYNKKLKGLGELEKITGRGAFDHLLVKPRGKVILAPISDDRPRIEGTPPETLFENIEVGEYENGKVKHSKKKESGSRRK